MAYEIVLGRSPIEKRSLGIRGSVYLGKLYVQMGQTTSLSNPVYLDVNSSHVVFVCGKRGSGKSYAMSAIAEGMITLPEDIKNDVAIVLLDTMGVFWTMKYPNTRDEEMLKNWGLEPKSLDVKIFTPKGVFDSSKDKGIPVDKPFSLRPSELDGEDWCTAFSIDVNSPLGVYIDRVILDLKEKNSDYDILSILQKVDEVRDVEEHVRIAAKNRFIAVERWGLFEKGGTPITDLVCGGQATILDLSEYATMPNGWQVKFLVVGLISKKLFLQRMKTRKSEELEAVKSAVHVLAQERVEEKMPLVWLVIDEAHEFLPKDGKTASSDALIAILREGRQPGISLILATQQPGKIHTDVMTQSDVVISFRLTAKIDIDALSALMQSYLREGLNSALDKLPTPQGSAIVLDDKNERLYQIKVRPKVSWHGGGSPTLLKEEKTLFSFEI